MDSLIKIEGKPLEKLIDVVSNAIGNICKPWQIVREARAEEKAESIKAIGQAKIKAILDGDLDKAQYLETINERLVAKETKRQKNIENVVAVAGKVLQAEGTVSEESVNPDWATRFFDIAQDVSDEEMQNLWGQILAGEIKQPQSYSLRTMETLRNMTKDEALLFQKVAQFTLYQGEAFLFSFANVLDKFGVTCANLIRLSEIGLIQPGDNIVKNIFSNSVDANSYITYGSLILIINIKANASKITFPIKVLTTAAKELLKLISINPNLDYFKELASHIKRSDVNVSYSKIIDVLDDGRISYDSSVIAL